MEDVKMEPRSPIDNMEMLQQVFPVVGLVNWSEHVRDERGRVVSTFTGTQEDTGVSHTVVSIGRTPEGEAGPGTTFRTERDLIFELKGEPAAPKKITDYLGGWTDTESINRWNQARARMENQIETLGNLMLKVDENAKIDNRQVSGYLYQMLNYADGQSLLAIIEKKMEIKKTGDPDMIFAALMRGEDTPEIVKIRPDTGAGAELFVMLKQQERGYEMLKSANSSIASILEQESNGMPSELVNQRSRFLVACEKRAVYGKLKKAERDLADLQRQARMLELRNEKLGLEGQRNTLQASKAAIELTVVDIETKITAKQDELAGNVARLLELRAMMNESPSNFGLFAEYGQMGPAGKTLEAELQQLVAEKQGIDDQIGAANEQIVALEDRIAEIEAQLQ